MVINSTIINITLLKLKNEKERSNPTSTKNHLQPSRLYYMMQVFMY